MRRILSEAALESEREDTTMAIQLLKDYLDQNRVKYVSIRHSEAFTALEVAASAHVSGKQVAKTVMVKLDGEIAMVVVTAAERIDFEKLRETTGVDRAELAQEHEFAHLFPGCEVGAMPPFGNLWGLPVWVSESLLEDEEIAFEAGTHTELLRMAYADYHRLVDPEVIAVS